MQNSSSHEYKVNLDKDNFSVWKESNKTEFRQLSFNYYVFLIRKALHDFNLVSLITFTSISLD